MSRVAARWIGKQGAQPDLSLIGLEGLLSGKPVTLYHGTTSLFHTFDISKSRDELVNAFYGRGIFLTPSKQVAKRYAEANRNIGFDPSIIDDLKKKNPGAGQFLQDLFDKGQSAFQQAEKVDWKVFEESMGGANPDTLWDISEWILGSKAQKGPSNEPVNIFSLTTGAPDWLYDQLDEVGLDSKKYRPKVYTVTVTVSNTLVTANNAQARAASRKGYDAVVFYGKRTIDDVPEVAVFNPKNVKIQSIKVI